MTPCRNCKNGTVTDFMPLSDGSLEWELEYSTGVCPCCGGEYEDCENCAKEFPNSVEEVQTKDYSWD